MELNSILDWAVVFSIIQLNVWQILHIRKSKTTWERFYNINRRIDKVAYKCQHTPTDV